MELLTGARRLPSLWRTAPRQGSWMCSSCRHKNAISRRFLSSSPKPRSSVSATAANKPYYVTTPIFYVNASPHIGHMYTMVLADVLKRWEALQGRRALLCTGTDEHGMKVQRAAMLEDVPPKQFCDANAATFLDLAQRSQVDNDFFIRTTDADHIDAVKYFWMLLRERGYIYESKHAGWYCVSDETFYPESMVEKRIAPMTGKPFMASIETGNAVEWTEEKNYHFRMTALKDKLLDFYKQNPDWVVPATRMNEVVNWVENNLEDLSISRPLNRLDWGVPVPDDAEQTVYVWVDALINYITKAGFPAWTPGAEHEGGWPADVQVIGKDILRFHAVYWPALLLAVDLPPPRRILSHAHWTLGRKKMSKSIGNVVNPFFALDRWGVDTMRYYLMHDGGIAHDSDYGNEYIVERYKKDLQWGLGNLLGRVTRPKIWRVAEVVGKASPDGGLDALNEAPEVVKNHAAMLSSLRDIVSAKMDELNPSAALREIIQAVYETNKYVHAAAPWELARKTDDTSKSRLVSTVYHAAESLRIVGILLQPFMPAKASELLDVLGVSVDKRDFGSAQVGQDFGYGVPMTNPGKGALDGLFPPLPVET